MQVRVMPPKESMSELIQGIQLDGAHSGSSSSSSPWKHNQVILDTMALNEPLWVRRFAPSISVRLVPLDRRFWCAPLCTVLAGIHISRSRGMVPEQVAGFFRSSSCSGG